ncbi:prophage CP4-57 integrase [mine drainage metagenome]|uniref:Prophage CP4-57 integrase n=1 Tax=mine drainage metagenome TaxID=410659 RepID=A0A1J5QLP3_9ZZZZ
MVALEWHEKRKKGWTERTAVSTLHRLEMYLFPKLGGRPIGEISAAELLAVVREIEARGATFLAGRMMQIAGRIFRYGIATGKCAFDPSPALRGALETHVGKHQPSVKPAEFHALMKAIAGYGVDQRGDESTRLGLQMLALTFLRTRELVEAPWDEFDLERATWKIGAERMKMKRPHIVPLSAPAIAILGRLKAICGGSTYILPGRNARVPMSNNTLLFALYRLGYRGLMTGHGFRSVASTMLNEQGFRPDVIERQLAHEDGDAIRAAYNHAEYLNERREMMEWWGQYLAPMLQRAPVAE